jgi:uncharacterized membrane protein YkoI
MEAALKLNLFAMLVLASIASPAWADQRDHELAREAVRSGQAMPLSEILSRIRLQLGGEVIHVELEREEGRYVYEFRVIGADGKLRKLHVDAATAKVLETEDR